MAFSNCQYKCLENTWKSIKFRGIHDLLSSDGKIHIFSGLDKRLSVSLDANEVM